MALQVISCSNIGGILFCDFKPENIKKEIHVGETIKKEVHVFKVRLVCDIVRPSPVYGTRMNAKACTHIPWCGTYVRR